MKRASNITDVLERRIVALIESIPEKISWAIVIALVSRELGQQYTEQGLRKHVIIADAYRVRKTLLAKQRTLRGGRRLQEATAKKIIELERFNERLLKENNQLIERFVVWSHNAASLHNMTESELDEPISVAN